MLPFDAWNHSFGLKQIDGTAIYYLKGYNSKEHYEPLYGSQQGKTVEHDKIFKEAIQIGNFAANKNQQGEEGFFKTQYYTLAKEWAFGIVMKTTASIDDLSKKYYLHIGGDRKLFEITVTEATIEKPDYQAYSHPNLHKLLLLSDTLLPKTETQPAADFAIASTAEFRHLRSSIEQTQNYYNRTKRGDAQANLQPTKTLYTVLQRGSVFYFSEQKNCEAFAQFLNFNKLPTVGFNRYIIISPSQKNN
ncbi:MAG: hypothetical protein IPL35_12740 [Sphingobacteriales bacterium]|nr:hypothetical protein [Sphingobacteriales bacterium]